MIATSDRVRASGAPARLGRAGGAGRSRWLRRLEAAGAAGVIATVGPAYAQPNFGLQQRAAVLEHATLLTADGETIEDAMVVIRGETIEHVGPAIEVQGRATRIDCQGGYVTSGLIDVYSALGMTATRSGGAVHRAFDAFDRYDTDAFREAFRNGVTMMYLPATGSRGVVGTGAIVRLAPGEGGGWAGDAVKQEAALCIDLGSGDSALGRLSTLDALRRQFKDAKSYRESLETYEDDLKEYEQKIKDRAEQEAKEGDKSKEGDKPTEGDKAKAAPPEESKEPAKPAEGDKKDEITKPKKPSPDPGADLVLKAIDHEMKVRILADRSSDILNALDFAREFGLDIIIEGGTEAYLVPDPLAEAKVPVVLGSMLGAGMHQESQYRRHLDRSAQALTEAGVKWVVGSGVSDRMSSRFVLLNAQMVAANVKDADPLRMVTRDAAELLGVGERFGRLAPRRAADVVVWTGQPLEAGSRVDRVYVDGRLVYRESASVGGAPEGGEQ